MLCYLGGYEGAIESLSPLIDAFTKPSGAVTNAFDRLNDDSSSALQTTLQSSVTIDPPEFRSRFYSQERAAVAGINPFSISMADTNSTSARSLAQERKLTLEEYRRSFPKTAAHVALIGLGPIREGNPIRPFPESLLPSQDYLGLLAEFSLLGHCTSSGQGIDALLAQELWILLGEFYLANGRIREAEMALQEALVLNELNHRAHHLQGKIYEGQKKWRFARDSFDLALQINPRSIESLFELARYHLRHASEDTLFVAVQYLLRILSTDVRNVTALSLLGHLMPKLGMDSILIGGNPIDLAQLHDMILDLEESDPLMPFSTNFFYLFTF